ncbi:hypothetical protein BT69DRAFT_1256610 [Atractiella rhizophila]|nr:hypothetical protein BT69DRAFT_1256610 [Atractiella rhizophila]
MDKTDNRAESPEQLPVARAERGHSISGGRPKGILKNPSSDGHRPTTLQWDEQNIEENEAQRTERMKITEPKTPYVRYNPETDTVENMDKIPGFELDQSEPYHSHSSASEAGGPSPSSSRRSSGTGGEKMVHVEIPREFGAGDESGSELEDEETKEKRKKFARMRGSHYKNEAEAMRRASQLMDEEEDEEDDDAEMDEQDEDPDETKPPKKVNGVNGKHGKTIPPVPPLPSNLQ